MFEFDDDSLGIVDLVIEDVCWDDVDLLGMFECVVWVVGEWLDLDDFQVVVMGCDDDRIVGLNVEFWGKLKLINVFSWFVIEFDVCVLGVVFELYDIEEFGDIVILFDICQCEVEVQGKFFVDYVMYLLVYVMLYFVGYDYIDDLDVEIMEDVECLIFGKLGIFDFYLELEI